MHVDFRISIFGIHMLLILLYSIHFIVCIQINMLVQIHIFRICIFLLYFYWSLFKPKDNIRSVWDIIKNPVPPTRTKADISSGRIVFLCYRYYCHSFYQVQGAYAHLNQKREKDLDKAVRPATRIVYYDEPLHLAITYEFLVKIFPEPLDGMLKKQNLNWNYTFCIYVSNYLWPYFPLDEII